MAAINGLAAAVAWTGYSGLYTSGFVAPYRFALDVQGATFPTTSFSPTVIVATNGALPYSWGATITARLPTVPASGYSANVSWGAGNHAVNAREYSLEIAWGEKDVTSFSASGVTSKSFIPLIASWRGSYSGYVDGSTAMTLPTVPAGTIQTLTLKAKESGTDDDSFSGTALVTQLSNDVGVETGGDYTYTFEGTGQLTANPSATIFGVNTTGIFDDSAGTLLTPTAGELTLTAASGRTYVGNAFPVGFSVRANVAQGMEAVIRVRGTGALTIA